jgi:iron(III) transport system ATP-binding protein
VKNANDGESLQLEIRDVTVRHGTLVAVDGASLDVPRNGITALVGPSGCGKTSLLRAIAGFEVPSGGTVSIAGRPVASRDCWVAPEQRSVGMVFQQGALFPHLTVRQNVGYGLSGRSDADSRARATIELVGLSQLCRRYPDELSGGEQQRVALARALAPGPEVVLLDEPFANLDAATRQQVRDEVCSILRSAGATAVIVTHDQQEALSIADRVAVMMRGRILQVGTAERIYREARTASVAKFIGDGQLLPCEIRAGRLVSALGPAESDAADGPALLLVRAEDLILSDGSTEGVGGQVRERRFYGHDLVHAVRLESGEVVQVRGPCSETFAPGAAVRLRLRRMAYRVYPTDDGAEVLGQATPVESHT